MIGLSRERKISIIPFIIIMIIIFIIGAIPSMVHARNKKNFNLCYNLGEEAMSDGRYNDAFAYYSKAVKYNDKADLVLKIESAARLAKSSFYFEKGLLAFYHEDYAGAMESFEKVHKLDEERFAVASEKINQCKGKCTENLILSAKEKANEGNFKEAIEFLDEAISMDPANTEAIDIKTKYLEEMQRIADEEAKRKLMEEKKAQQKNQSNKDNQDDNKNGEDPSTEEPKQEEPTTP